MSYDCMDMLRLSQEFSTTSVNTVLDETRWRAAISRAYYACFLTARDALFGDRQLTDAEVRKIPAKDRGGSHARVAGGLGAHPKVDLGKRKRLKDKLEELKSFRVAADYRREDSHVEVQKLFKRFDADGWEDLAHESLTLASQLLPELARLPAFTTS